MSDIKVLIPDLPSARQLLPWLERIDTARCYSNFGPLVRELEETLTAQWPRREAPLHVVTLNSGTAPLELAIDAMRLPRGANVLLPALTFPATAAAVTRNALAPVLADVDPGNWQLTPELALRAGRQFPLALVMPVATFGCPVDVAGWDEFSDATGIPVLIDGAAAFGNQAIGERSSVAFSFHATKPFGIGEGGALVTRDADLAARVRRLSNFGFEHSLVDQAGGNAKMSEYAAAVALAQWERWPGLWRQRQRQWSGYAGALAAVPGLRLQQGFAQGALPAMLVARLPVAAAALRDGLAAAGIETRRWYYPPLYCHPAFAGAARCGHMPVTADLAEHSLGLPWHTRLSGLEGEQVAAQLRRLLAQEYASGDSNA